jgi:hypothetical protein
MPVYDAIQEFNPPKPSANKKAATQVAAFSDGFNNPRGSVEIRGRFS